MIGTLYRYPHPHDPTRFIYVGQGPNRDAQHRSGKSSFGRRFKKLFSDIELPQPIKEQVETSSQFGLNEEETIWMFRYHTWYGYLNGMNLQLPGSTDYKNAGKIGGSISGLINGRKNAENGHMITISAIGRTPEHQIAAGRLGGRHAVESGQLNSIRDLPQTKFAQSKVGRKNVESGHLDKVRTKAVCSKGGTVVCCLRWNIRRGKPCTCGTHKTITI
jgi:hypothetical protein